MKKLLFILGMISATLCVCGQDIVVFKSGRMIAGEVLAYSNGVFSVLYGDSVRQAQAGNIDRIEFSGNHAKHDEFLPELESKTDAMPHQLSQTEETVVPPPNQQPQPQAPAVPTLSKDLLLTFHGYDETVSTDNREVLHDMKVSGMKFVTVNIQFVNNSAETLGAAWSTFKLKTQDGTVCRPTIWVPKAGLMEWTYVRPKGKAKGKVGFAVPINIDMTKSYVRYEVMPTIGHPFSPDLISEWFPLR